MLDEILIMTPISHNNPSIPTSFDNDTGKKTKTTPGRYHHKLGYFLLDRWLPKRHGTHMSWSFLTPQEPMHADRTQMKRGG